MLWFVLLNPALAGGPKPPAFDPLPVAAPQDAVQFCADGLRVTVMEDARADLVSITTVQGSGALDDRAGGELALIQRLSLRSRLADGDTVAERLAELGATPTRWSDLDTSSLHTLGHSSVLAELLLVELARIRNPLAGITPEVFLAERHAEAVRLEDVTSRDTVQLARYFASAFQDGHPYAKMTVATPATVGALELGRLRKVAATAYTLANTTILVRGGADPTIVGQVLTAQGGGDATCDALTAPAQPKAQPGGDAIRSFEAPVAERTLVLGWALPPEYRGDDAVMDAAMRALSSAIRGGVGSTYAQRQKFQLTCGRLPGAQASLALCAMHVPEGTSARSVARRALSHLGASHAIDDAYDTERTARTVAAALNRVPLDFEKLNGGAPVAHFEHITHSVDYTAYALDEIQNFSGERVAALTKTWFRPDLTHMVLLYPPGTDGDPEAGSVLAEEEAGASKDETEAPDDGEDPATATVSIRLADEAPALLRDTQLGTPTWLARATEMQLENGLRVVIAPWAASPLVRVALVLGGGDASEPFVGLDALTERLVDSRGAVPHGSSELSLSDAAMRVGGEWNNYNTRDARVYGVRVGAGQLDAATYMVRRRIDGLALDLTADERAGAAVDLSRWVDSYGDSPYTARWWALRAWRIALWGPDHPNARARSEAAWWAIPDASADDVRGWYSARLRPDHATLYIVGDVDPKEAEAVVRARLGDWKRPKAALPAREYEVEGPLPEARVFTVAVPDSRVTWIHVGCPVAPANAAVRRVGEVLLDDALLERLILDPAISASAGGNVTEVIDGAAVAAVAARVSPARTAVTLRAIDGLLAELAAPLDAERVQKAQATVLRGQVTRWTTGGELLDDLVRTGGPTGDLSSFRSFGDDLRAVTPADVAKLFASCTTHVVALAAVPRSASADVESAVAIDREAEYRALRNRKASATTPAPGVTVR